MQEKQEEIKEIKRTLNDLTAKFEDKFDELSKSVEEQQENAEEKINENAAHITSLENTRASGHATTQAGLLLRRMDSLEKNRATTSLDPRVAALEPQLESMETRIATLENKKQSDK
jgi:t-SNARE complex subunit (syntaxin)